MSETSVLRCNEAVAFLGFLLYLFEREIWTDPTSMDCGSCVARPRPHAQSESWSAHDIRTSSRAHANLEIKKPTYIQCGELN
jgi:hypothetical protein